MKRLEYENYEGFVCDIADTFDSLEDEFDDVSIIVKYGEAKEIIRELLCLGYDVASIDIHDELWENYCDEYIVSVSNVNDFPSVWCEKFKRETGYINDESSVAYVMDNCSSAVFKHINSEEIYEVCVGENDLNEESDDVEDEAEHTYTVNGKSVDKKTFNEYVSQFAPDLVDENNNESRDADLCEKSTETYRVNGKDVSRDIYLKAVKKFEDNYTNAMRRNLFDYYGFMDAVNEWRRYFVGKYSI